MKVPEAARVLRKLANRKLEDVAHEVGVGSSYLSDLERDKCHKLSLELAERMVKPFGLELWEVLQAPDIVSLLQVQSSRKPALPLAEPLDA